MTLIDDSGPFPPPPLDSLPIVYCPGCTHPLDEHTTHNPPTEPTCSHTPESPTHPGSCRCHWTPNEIAAYTAALTPLTPSASLPEIPTQSPDFTTPATRLAAALDTTATREGFVPDPRNPHALDSDPIQFNYLARDDPSALR